MPKRPPKPIPKHEAIYLNQCEHCGCSNPTFDRKPVKKCAMCGEQMAVIKYRGYSTTFNGFDKEPNHDMF